MNDFSIDKEFQDLILPPLHPGEAEKLEANILADGEVREPLVVWNGILLDGHNRWAIIQKHPELPYKIKEIDLPDRWAAILWMHNNQLGRRNLTEAEKRLLIGNMYRIEQKAHGGDRRSEGFSSGQNDHLKDFPENAQETTRQRIAKKTGTSDSYVRRAAEFADGLDAAEEASPGFRNAVLSGEVKAPQQTISNIRKLPVEDRPAAVEAIKNSGKVVDFAAAFKEKLAQEERQDAADYAVYKAFWKAVEGVMRFADDPISTADAVVRAHVDHPDFTLSDADRIGAAIEALRVIQNRLLLKGGAYGKTK